ncbi:hypothetical protein [Candidatus Tisiphia endosymbiont of Nemotelus nigrinus]|uniref:hypothetical protein n=1 Tax=Candidatus Tisiphia endosymbiont of Nemotelus nigrinus TaxID=3066263 RepID=UPI00312C920B
MIIANSVSITSSSLRDHVNGRGNPFLVTFVDCFVSLWSSHNKGVIINRISYKTNGE